VRIAFVEEYPKIILAVRQMSNVVTWGVMLKAFAVMDVIY